jgi:hypothetical protein
MLGSVPVDRVGDPVTIGMDVAPERESRIGMPEMSGQGVGGHVLASRPRRMRVSKDMGRGALDPGLLGAALEHCSHKPMSYERTAMARESVVLVKPLDVLRAGTC